MELHLPIPNPSKILTCCIAEPYSGITTWIHSSHRQKCSPSLVLLPTYQCRAMCLRRLTSAILKCFPCQQESGSSSILTLLESDSTKWSFASSDIITLQVLGKLMIVNRNSEGDAEGCDVQRGVPRWKCYSQSSSAATLWNQSCWRHISDHHNCIPQLLIHTTFSPALHWQEQDTGHCGF